MELIDRGLHAKTPEKSRHATGVHLAADCLRRVFGSGFHVRICEPRGHVRAPMSTGSFWGGRRRRASDGQIEWRLRVPEKGRPAASSGNAYQDVRVASCLIDLLEDMSVTSVAVETLDEIDDLVVRRAGRAVRYEQVKERAPSGRWTAQRLSDGGVLRQFFRQHRVEPSGELVLFTGSDASDLREVVDRARNASRNHPNDELGREAALTEWKRRLEGRHRFVDQILSRNRDRRPSTHDDVARPTRAAGSRSGIGRARYDRATS